MVSKRYCPKGHDTSVHGRHPQGICKVCKRAMNRQWALKNPERVQRKHIENALKQKYGISVSSYEAMVKQQNGQCAICYEVPTNKRLSVDHSHITGKVRMLLCNKCNQGLGYFRDNAYRLLRASNYILENI